MPPKRKHEVVPDPKLSISTAQPLPEILVGRPKWKRAVRKPSIMKDDHKDILMSKRGVLVANMHLSDALLNDLISEKILKIEEKDAIRRNDATENEKVQRFLDILIRKPDQAYTVLIRLLRRDSQEHVAVVLDADFDLPEDDDEDLSNSESDLGNLVKTLYLRMLQLLDLETGAMDDLLSHEIINQIQYDNISELPSFKKNEEFLTFVISHCPPRHYETILNILGNCHQQHVVNFIRARGEINTSFGEDRVLTEDEVKRITVNQKSFIDLITPDVIVPKLQSLNVITTRHSNAILCKENDAEKNRKLIEIIKRRSFGDAQKFCAVLKEHDMEYLAKAVQGEGVIAIIHAKQEGPSAKKMSRTELHQDETVICKNVNRSLNEPITTEDMEKYQHCRDIAKLRDRGITMVNVSPTGSIAVYVLCSSRQAVQDLWEMLQTGVLRRYLESIFTGCSALKSDLVISFSVNPEDSSLMFHYPWAFDDSCELESPDCSLDLTPNVELVDILELVRDKQITLEEAERWIKDERDSGEMDVEQPSRKRAVACQSSVVQKPSLIATCRSNSSFEADSITANWQNVISDGSFRFISTHSSPVFGRGKVPGEHQ